MRYWLVFSLTIVFAACSHLVEPPFAADEILIVNQTGKTIYYAAFEQEMPTLILWAPNL
jgi:hypothetical protein